MASEKNEYALAGWLAIAAAVLILPSFVLGIAVEIVKHRSPELVIFLLVPYFVVSICSTIFGVYVVLQFRKYLNDRHGFHAIDGLITATVIGFIAMTLYGIPMKILGTMGILDKPPMLFLLVAPIAVMGIILGILGIIIGIRLLKMPSGDASYFRVYAWLSIAAGICFVTFLLGPLGGLIDATGYIVLAMLFFKNERDEIESTPEFV